MVGSIAPHLRTRRAFAPVLVLVLAIPLGVRAGRAADAAGPAIDPPGARSGTWTAVDRGRGEAPVALAVAEDGRWAVADETGVRVGGGAGVGRGALPVAVVPPHDAVRRAALEGVTDLAFDGRGRLWIATRSGLRVWSSDAARPARRPLRDGEQARSIARLAVDGDALALATDAGVYWSSEGALFQPLDAAGVREPASLVTLRVEPGSAAPGPRRAAVWQLGRRALWRTRGHVAPAGLRVLERASISLPRPLSETAPVDLRLAPARPGRPAQLVLLYPDAIAERPHVAEAGATAAWRLTRPVLAPGARMRRIAFSDRGLVVASDRGLFEAASAAGPFRRLAGALGVEACADVAAAGARLLALCRSGLHAWRPSGAAPRGDAQDAAGPGAVAAIVSPAAAPASPIPEDPPLAEIRRRALAAAGLEVSRGARLRKGLRRRGWLPEVGLVFGADLDREDRRFHDQAFTSGDTRRLFDRTRERGAAFDATLSLDWSLGELAYPEDAVDLSRELRQVIALRDDVADEIHQLYFERASIRARLAASPPLPAAEAAALRLRAAELGAGLDAWTGGWLAGWWQTRDARAE